MPLKVVKKFDVEYLQILDEKGKCDTSLLPELSKDQLRDAYRYMVLSRIFDEKALTLQRQGRIGTYAPHQGQEACQVGSVMALEKEDWIFPAFRESAAFIARGVPPTYTFQYWGGDERGSKLPEGMNNFTVSVPVGSQIIHATGVAYAMKHKGEHTCALVYFGDGATSEGEFHESLNTAGVFQLPVIFLCQNNQYAISVPRERQTHAQTIAQKAIAYGIRGIQVDGNDFFAVYQAVKEAAQQAKKGHGPTLIECITYRLGDHTTSDDAKRYRSEKEVALWKKRDPITRLENYLLKKDILKEKDVTAIANQAKKEIEKSVEEYEKIKPEPVDAMFDSVYAELPQRLEEQKKKAVEGGS